MNWGKVFALIIEIATFLINAFNVISEHNDFPAHFDILLPCLPLCDELMIIYDRHKIVEPYL